MSRILSLLVPVFILMPMSSFAQISSLIPPSPKPSAMEGSDVVFEFTLHGQHEDAVMFNYETYDGSAVAGQDYSAAQGTLTFASGDNNETIRIRTFDDDDNNQEYFSLVVVEQDAVEYNAGVTHIAVIAYINAKPLYVPAPAATTGGSSQPSCSANSTSC